MHGEHLTNWLFWLGWFCLPRNSILGMIKLSNKSFIEIYVSVKSFRFNTWEFSDKKDFVEKFPTRSTHLHLKKSEKDPKSEEISSLGVDSKHWKPRRNISFDVTG